MPLLILVGLLLLQPSLSGAQVPEFNRRGLYVDPDRWTWENCNRRERSKTCQESRLRMVTSEQFPMLADDYQVIAFKVAFTGPRKGDTGLPRSPRRRGAMRDDFIAYHRGAGSLVGSWFLFDRVSGTDHRIECPKVFDGRADTRVQPDPHAVFIVDPVTSARSRSRYAGDAIDREAVMVVCQLATLEGASVSDYPVLFQLKAESDGRLSWIERSPGVPLGLWRDRNASHEYQQGLDGLVAFRQRQVAAREMASRRAAAATAQRPENAPFPVGSYCVGWSFINEDERVVWLLADLTVSRATTAGELRWRLENALSNNFGQDAYWGGYKLRSLGRGVSSATGAHVIEPRTCSRISSRPPNVVKQFSVSWP